MLFIFRIMMVLKAALIFLSEGLLLRVKRFTKYLLF